MLAFSPTVASAQRALANETLLDYVRGREDLPRRALAKWEREVKKRFGGAALEAESEVRVEITVAKAIISSAIFMGVEPKRGVSAAWEGWRGALGYVPPPIAIHYEILSLEGSKPRGRAIDLAFNFPEYYSEEIAPDLVAYWEDAMEKGKIPDAALEDTKRALRETRAKMRPLLLDKLRLLARLARDLSGASAIRRAEIQSDLRIVEEEIKRSFSNVARRPEVIDARKRPFDRLRIQLEDMGLAIGNDDRLLDPDAPPPAPIPVPAEDARPSTQPALIDAYRSRLAATIEPWLGTPYRLGRSAKGAGTDCSGFSLKIYEEGFSIPLPRTSRDQYLSGRSVSTTALKPGDLVFFDPQDIGRVSHVGVYSGSGAFVHASSTQGVSYAKLDERYYRRAYRGARRVLAYPE